jgi:starch phosphorylase
VQAWRLYVGRSVIYLLDTDVPENPDYFRGLTSLAYGGDMNMRIRQEIVLGVGGTRFLRLIGVTPSVYHMNEGHAAFLTLELLTEELLRDVSKEKAEKTVRSKCIFTTHTPVPAGHDRFPVDLMEFTLRPYIETVKLTMEELMAYGQAQGGDTKNEFTMTILGLKLSRGANGVSRKHGEISRLMWSELYPGKKAADIPIGHVTNGIHVPSWTTSTSWEFWERHNSHRWKEHLNDQSFWKHVADPEIVSDAELWALRYQLRRELIEFVRNKARAGMTLGGPTSRDGLAHLFSTDALTIGFARRFAPYKRAPLIFSDLAKALMIFGDPQRPVQLLFAGKAHPRDSEGKELLRHIVEITRQPPFSGKVILLENYDINVARHMVSGCDVWLNTPRRPLEASGTSGQKVTINTGLNLSILDGWWLEAYNGKNGWAIGKKIESNFSPEEVDKKDADSLYSVLLNDVIPSFYERDASGIPTRWVARIRNAMQTIIPYYNTHRMVLEYASKYYFPKR